MDLKSHIKKNRPGIIGLLLGAIGGYAYYRYIGCSSGSCPITSNPHVSTLYGALMGYLLLSMFKTENKE